MVICHPTNKPIDELVVANPRFGSYITRMRPLTRASTHSCIHPLVHPPTRVYPPTRASHPLMCPIPSSGSRMRNRSVSRVLRMATAWSRGTDTQHVLTTFRQMHHLPHTLHSISFNAITYHHPRPQPIPTTCHSASTPASFSPRGISHHRWCGGAACETADVDVWQCNNAHENQVVMPLWL